MAGLVACVSIGRAFPADQVTAIRLGETTRAEIEATFGQPWRTGIEDGMPTWTYAQYSYSLFGHARTRDLVVRFDDRSRVSSYTFNSTYPPQPAP